MAYSNWNKTKNVKFSPKMLIDLRYVPDYEKIKELAERSMRQKNYIYGTNEKVGLAEVFTKEYELSRGTGFLPIKYQKLVGMSVMGQLPALSKNADGSPYPNIRPAIQTYIGDEVTVIRNIWKIHRMIRNAIAKYNEALQKVPDDKRGRLGEVSEFVTLGTFDKKRGVMQALPSKTFALARSIYDLCYDTFYVGVGQLMSRFYDKDSIPEEKKETYNQIVNFSDVNKGCLTIFNAEDKWGTNSPNYLNAYSSWAIDPPRELAGLDTIDEVDVLNTWNCAFNRDYTEIAKEMTTAALDNWKNLLLYRSLSGAENNNSSGITLDNEYGQQLSLTESLQKHVVIDKQGIEAKDPFKVIMEMAAEEGITDKAEIMRLHAKAFGVHSPVEPEMKKEEEQEVETEFSH